MKKMLDSSVSQLVLASVLLAGVYYGTQATIPSFQSLPVDGLNAGAAAPVSTTITPDSLYPLMAKAPAKQTAAPSLDDVIQIDKAFLPPEATAKTEEASAPQDYFLILQQNQLLNLQAITDAGAIINGRFYAFGSPMTEWAYPGDNNKTVSPLLRTGNKSNSVRIAEAGTKRSFALSLKND